MLKSQSIIEQLRCTDFYKFLNVWLFLNDWLFLNVLMFDHPPTHPPPLCPPPPLKCSIPHSYLIFFFFFRWTHAITRNADIALKWIGVEKSSLPPLEGSMSQNTELSELEPGLLFEVHKVLQTVCGSNQTESDGQVPKSLLPDPVPEDWFRHGTTFQQRRASGPSRCRNHDPGLHTLQSKFHQCTKIAQH